MFEYKVIPAPMQVKRSKGAKTAAERLAIEVQDSINALAAEGWEYVRSDTMTVMDKPGLLSRPIEVIETVLIFRRSQSESKPIIQKPQVEAKPEPTPAPKSEPLILEAKTEPLTLETKVEPAPIPTPAPRVEPEAPKPMVREPRESVAPRLGGAKRY